MKHFKIIIAVVLFSSAAQAQQAGNHVWYTCRQDTDCVKRATVPHSCYPFFAMNKKYVNAYDAFLKKNSVSQECMPPSAKDLEGNKKHPAMCMNGMCQIAKKKFRRAV